MKKIIKKLFITILAVLCICLSVFSAYADMILEYDGYQYSIFNNTSISLEGWDNRTPELVVPDSIVGRYFISVANYGLKDNTEITSVDFSQVTRLRRIGMNAFQGCTGINQPLIFPESLTTINDAAFRGCSAIPELTTNSALTSISDQCFYGCSSLRTVNLAEGLQSIKRIAFANCTSLEYVNIPKSVTAIDSTAFYNDTNLTLGVWYGSYGYNYSKENNINYTLLDGVKLGDVNGDGVVNIIDVTSIQRHLAMIGQLDGIYLHAADANQSGAVDISDATNVQMFIAMYDIANPIGEVMTK